MVSAVCSVEVAVNEGPKIPAALVAIWFYSLFFWQWCFLNVT